MAKRDLKHAAIEHQQMVIDRLWEQRTALLDACRAARRKLRGTNIMGEQIHARTLAKLNAAIRLAEKEI